MVIQQTIPVEQATYMAGVMVAKFVTDLKAALKLGVGHGEIIALVNAAVSDLTPVLTNVSSLVSDASDNQAAEVNTLALVGAAIVIALKS